MKLYVVTADGWIYGYGAEIYLVGVFSDKGKAEEVIEENNFGVITEVVLDEVYPMKNSNGYADAWGNGNYLGGYIE